MLHRRASAFDSELQLGLQTKLSYSLSTEHCLDLVTYFYILTRVDYSHSLVRVGPNQPLKLRALRSLETSEMLIHVLLI